MSRKDKDIHKAHGYKPLETNLEAAEAKFGPTGREKKTEVEKFTHSRGKHVTIIQGILAIPFDFYEYPPLIESSSPMP